MNEQPDTFRVKFFVGHVEVRQMPMIFAGRVFGQPYEFTNYDGDGNVRDRYYTPPRAWMYYT